MADFRRVAVLFTGGTISMTVEAGAGGVVPTLGGAELLARTPGIAALAEVIPIDLGRTPASHFGFADLLAIHRSIEAALTDPRVAGVVVVQGTDTLEETAFGWDLIHHERRPVVVTGAMRNASEPAWDGPTNLRDAIAVATEPRLHGAGVVVALAGTIHPADDVVKSHATALDTFRSPNDGPLGTVRDGRVVLARTRGSRRRLDGRPAPPPGPVDLVTAALETYGRPIDLAVAGGAAGIVVAATGAGNTHPDLLRAAVQAMASGIPIVLATRTGGGRVTPTYAFPGGGARWERAGAILAGTLTPLKARVALALGLGAELDRDALADLLADPPVP